MKPGELRRFKDLPNHGALGPFIAAHSGQTFVVIALHPSHRPGDVLDVLCTVDFLVGGRLETGWSQRWVGRHSEVLDVVE
jgi:hypothetical protein